MSDDVAKRFKFEKKMWKHIGMCATRLRTTTFCPPFLQSSYKMLTKSCLASTNLRCGEQEVILLREVIESLPLSLNSNEALIIKNRQNASFCKFFWKIWKKLKKNTTNFEQWWYFSLFNTKIDLTYIDNSQSTSLKECQNQFIMIFDLSVPNHFFTVSFFLS